MKEQAKKREQAPESACMAEGKNAVMELLRSGNPVDKVFVAEDMADGRTHAILSLAREQGAVTVRCSRRKLDGMSQTGAHQGMIAFGAPKAYVSLEDILETARQRGEAPLLVLCDGMTDPHNLGAVIRSAETAGAHGIVLPKRRSATLNETAVKASAGAVAHMAVARVPNLAMAIEELKERGVWIFGADAGGDRTLYNADFKGAAAIVIGSEGNGLSRIVREKCDFIVSIPMKGSINSLNASAAAAVLLYEAVRQRMEASYE